MKPTVLIATTSRWFPTARLGMALAKVGFTVDAVCPWRHPIGVATGTRRTYAFRGLSPIESLVAAITDAHPDLVLPCDDLAVSLLHRLYDREKRRGQAGTAICSLLERSLGTASSFSSVSARTAFMSLAKEEGVRAPETEVIANIDDLRKFATRMGFPIVLKSDGTSGGAGVRIVRTLAAAERAFRRLQAPPLFARALKRTLINQDTTLLLPSVLRTRFVVNAQTFVAGHEATSTVACWEGVVLASLHFEVISKLDSTGPSTVLRLINNADMTVAAERMVRRLGLSGVVGFDFMLDSQTGNAHLVEMNPRATQVGHLPLGRGHDLPAALYAAVTGETICESPKITENDTVALFPHEWLRSPESPFLQSGYHDVPWEEAEFIRVCVGTRRKRSALYSHRKQAQALAPARLPRQ